MTNAAEGYTRGRILNSADIPNGLLPANAVFVDRGSPWENPFHLGTHGNREEIYNRYEWLLAHSPEQLEAIDHLQGKDLICFHAPAKGHADLLLMLASIPYRERLHWAESVKAKHLPQAA